MGEPSTWGATFWKDFQVCERYHYHTYVEKLDTPDLDPALDCGIQFHDFMEARFLRGESPPPWPEDAAYPTTCPDWKSFPTDAAHWLALEYEREYGPVVNGREKPYMEDRLRGIAVESVETILTIEGHPKLLLPVSAKYDAVVTLEQLGNKRAALEHKTPAKAIQLQHYEMDSQVDLQIGIWNYLNPDDPLLGLIVDEANKAGKPAQRFRRELITRTPKEIEGFWDRVRTWQELYLTMCEKAAIIPDPKLAFPQRTTQCFKWGKPCKFYLLCKFGERASGVYTKGEKP